MNVVTVVENAAIHVYDIGGLALAVALLFVTVRVAVKGLVRDVTICAFALTLLWLAIGATVFLLQGAL